MLSQQLREVVAAVAIASLSANGYAKIPSLEVSPATAKVAAGAKQAFKATLPLLRQPSLVWMVNGQVGGGTIWGTITQQGVYTAPAIDPGATVTVSASLASNAKIIGTATVTVVNPPIPELSGATYANELGSWEVVLMPEIQQCSGLAWDDNTLAWSPVANWAPPSEGIGPQVYYLEEYLRPATRMAVVKQDIALMEELAKFHLAMLQWRTTTVGQMLANAGSDPVDFISGPSSARTFAWYQPYSSTRTEVADEVQANAQYLSQPSQLLRAIAEMPAASRTAPLIQFVQGYSEFLVTEQLIRLLYGSAPWSHYQNPNIPQPVVAGWQFLAQTGYEPPYPIKYQAAMTDMELWLVSDSADVLGADAAAPELGILNSSTRAQLLEAVEAGVSLMQARCHHVVSPDGADVLSAFPGDFDDHINYAYANDTGPQVPTTPNPRYGAAWDIEGAYRFPIVFRTLYETRSATSVSFPTLNDLVALTNSYVHLAFTGDPHLPIFNNFFDGWNGWFRVGDPGNPPEEYCSNDQVPINCMTGGAISGWGQLASVNPNLATLMQDIINLAYDDSPADQAFITQHYTYGGPYTVVGSQYPWLMIYVVGDSAERLP